MSWSIRELMTPACFISLTNAIFGTFSILASIARIPDAAARFILLSLIADSLDGFLARKTEKETEFGMNLDSMADLVSFVIAPATLMITTNLVPGPFSYGLAVLMVCCGSLRLARFNAMCIDGYSPKDYYLGLPVPWIGAIVSCLYFLTIDLGPSKLWQLLNSTVLIVSTLLMVSSVKFPSLKRPHPAILIVGGISLLVLLFSCLLPSGNVKSTSEATASGVLTALLSWYVARGVKTCFRDRR